MLVSISKYRIVIIIIIIIIIQVCYAVYTCGNVPTFKRLLLPPQSEYVMKHAVKHSETSVKYY
jgi:hypothetical protein